MTMISELRHRITINTIEQAEVADSAETATIFTVVATVYAKLEDLSGIVKYDTKQTGMEISHKITIRYWPGVCSQHWIKLGDRNFQVINVKNTLERNQYQELLVREVFEDEDLFRASEGRADEPVES